VKEVDIFIFLRLTKKKLMKNPISYLLILFVVAMAVACGGKKETAEAGAEEVSNDEWPGMDEFHMIMAESFHPYKDSSNLEPAKANAVEMARVAEKWAATAIPERVNNESARANLDQLKNDTAGFVTTVENGDETAIGEDLTKLHDLFHKLQEAWYGAGDGHDHH
jgi:hypothetical protein